MIELANARLYSLQGPIVFRHTAPAITIPLYHNTAAATNERGWVCHPLNCHPTSPRALAFVLMLVPLLPAAPPWVRTRVLPPLIWFAQRLALVPCATGRRVMVNWMPSMVVLVIGCVAVCFGIVVGNGGEVNPPPGWISAPGRQPGGHACGSLRGR